MRWARKRALASFQDGTKPARRTDIATDAVQKQCVLDSSQAAVDPHTPNQWNCRHSMGS